MNLEERKRVEDTIDAVLALLTRGEKAIFYKTLYAEGFKISDCDAIIRKEPPPRYTNERWPSQPRPVVAPRTHLAHGWPVLQRP